MGKQISTLKAAGKVGDVVGFTTMKGDVAMRAKSSKPYTSQTTKQIVQRTRFLAVTSLAQMFTPTLAGLTPYAKSKRITKRNAFVKLNMPAVTVPAPQAQRIEATTEYSKLILSRGTLGSVTFSSPRFDDTLSVKVNYAANLESYMATDDDEVMVFAYNEELDEIFKLPSAVRSDGTVTGTVPSSWTGTKVQVFGYCMGFNDAADRVAYESYWNGQRPSNEALAEIARIEGEAIYSNSVYIGNGTIQ